MTEKTAPPIYFVWTDEGAFRPLTDYLAKKCDEYFVVGERYRMAEEPERSMKSHAHFFAELNDMWKSLPEHLEADFPSFEHFRKHCLILAGFCDKRTFVASSHAEALRLAAFMRPVDQYAVIVVQNKLVVMMTAQSQAIPAMRSKDFQKAKDAVFNQAAILMGSKPPKVPR